MPDPLGITHQHSVADTWTVTLAKARFREVIERARVRGPQLITRRGRPAAMLVGAGESAPRTHRAATLADFFAASPLRHAADLVIERDAGEPGDALLQTRCPSRERARS